MKNKILNGYYYLAPLWFMIESFFWPNFRAGVVFGPHIWGNIAFYSIEAGLGAALWFRLPYADLSALAENIIYLVFALKFIVFTPVDIALSLGEDMSKAANLSHNYSAALPGIVYSSLHVVFRIEKQLLRR